MPCHGPVHLRRATLEDAPGIAGVHVRSWRRSHRDLLPAQALAAIKVKQREEFWCSQLGVEAPDRTPWVALVDDRVVGFAIAGLSRDDDAGPEAGEVYHVYVDPECWGRGIGHNLLLHVMRDLRCHGFASATFWILAQDDVARGWAEKQGWARDGGTRYEDWSGVRMEQVRYSSPLR